MPLYKITATQTFFNGHARIEKGMSVMLDSNTYPSREGYLPISGNREINDMFKCMYGLDLEKEGFLSSYYLKAELIDNDDNPIYGKPGKKRGGGSLLDTIADIFARM